MSANTPQIVTNSTEQALPVKRRAYTIKEVCRDFNVSPATLYRMKSAGQIKIIKIGGAYRILEEDLVKLEKGEA